MWSIRGHVLEMIRKHGRYIRELVAIGTTVSSEMAGRRLGNARGFRCDKASF
jgi:hypothetical protein